MSFKRPRLGLSWFQETWRTSWTSTSDIYSVSLICLPKRKSITPNSRDIWRRYIRTHWGCLVHFEGRWVSLRTLVKLGKVRGLISAQERSNHVGRGGQFPEGLFGRWRCRCHLQNSCRSHWESQIVAAGKLIEPNVAQSMASCSYFCA